MKTYRILILVGLMVVVSGCHHSIKFEEIDYTIGTKKFDSDLVLVLSPVTLNQTVSIRSFMTGVAHSWDASFGCLPLV